MKFQGKQAALVCLLKSIIFVNMDIKILNKSAANEIQNTS